MGAGVSETGHAPLNLISTFLLLSHSELFEESLEALLNNKRPSCMFGFYLRKHFQFSFLWIVHSWLPLRFSLDCPFLIAPSVFSGLSILDCPFCFLWIVHSWLPLRFSLDCPFLIAPSVFSGLSILDCPFGFLWIVHSWLPLRFSLTFFLTYLTNKNINSDYPGI